MWNRVWWYVCRFLNSRLCLFVYLFVCYSSTPFDFSWIVWRLILLLFVISLPSSSHPYCSLSKPFSSVYSWLCCIGASASCGRKVHTLLSSLFVCLLYISSRIYDLCMAKTHLSPLHLLRPKFLFWCLATRGELISSPTGNHVNRLFVSLTFLLWAFVHHIIFSLLYYNFVDLEAVFHET